MFPPPPGTTAPASDLLQPSSAVGYIPPEPKLSAAERVEKGVVRGIASTPQILGSGLQFMGSQFAPNATDAEKREGNTFGDRMYRMGVEMVEKNKKYIAEKFPEQPDLLERISEGVGGALPIAVGLGLSALADVPAAAIAGTGAVAMGAPVLFDTFNKLQAKGVRTIPADLKALLVAVLTPSILC